jgi:hypothetical protein
MAPVAGSIPTTVFPAVPGPVTGTDAYNKPSTALYRRSLFAKLRKTVNGNAAEGPAPEAGVVTLIFTFPGSARLAAGIVAVIAEELTKVEGTIAPFTSTVVASVNPVPYSVTAASVSIGPAFGRIEPKVGAGGAVICTTTAFERAGTAVGVSTCTLAVPTVLRSDAGTVAFSELLKK